MKTHWQILVVDDEEVMCESLAAWLREDGYHVDTAASGREALEKAAAAGLRHLLRGSQDAGRHGRHRDHDAGAAPASRSLHHHHHGLRHRGYGHHGDEGRRAGVHRQAVQSGGDFAAGQPHHQGEEPAAREHHPAQEAEPAVLRAGRDQQESQNAGDSGSGAPGFEPAQHGADSGRERHRQGDGGAGDSLFGRPRVEAVRGRLLRGAGRDAAGERTVRPREGLLHRSGAAEAGQVRDGRRRHHLPGRDRRHFSQAAGGPAARAAGPQLLPRGRDRRRSRWMCG